MKCPSCDTPGCPGVINYKSCAEWSPPSPPPPAPEINRRVIVGYGDIKREFEGPFHICGSRDWLLDIARQLIRECNYSDNFCYGWIQINIEMDDKGMTNNKPIKWHE